jgi:hypothetical protein
MCSSSSSRRRWAAAAAAAAVLVGHLLGLLEADLSQTNASWGFGYDPAGEVTHPKERLQRFPPKGAGGRAGQTEGVVELTIGEKSGVTGDGRAVELQLDLAVEINAQGVIVAVTHWVPRPFRQNVVGNAGFSREKAQTPCRSGRVIWEIRV